MLPVGVAALLPEHAVTTAKAAGYAGLLNGELIRRAEEDGCEVLVTADRNMSSQQNVGFSGIGIVLVPGNRVVEIEPTTAALRAAVAATRPGSVTRVERPTKHQGTAP